MEPVTDCPPDTEQQHQDDVTVCVPADAPIVTPEPLPTLTPTPTAVPIFSPVCPPQCGTEAPVESFPPAMPLDGARELAATGAGDVALGFLLGIATTLVVVPLVLAGIAALIRRTLRKEPRP